MDHIEPDSNGGDNSIVDDSGKCNGCENDACSELECLSNEGKRLHRVKMTKKKMMKKKCGLDDQVVVSEESEIAEEDEEAFIAYLHSIANNDGDGDGDGDGENSNVPTSDSTVKGKKDDDLDIPPKRLKKSSSEKKKRRAHVRTSRSRSLVDSATVVDLLTQFCGDNNQHGEDGRFSGSVTPDPAISNDVLIRKAISSGAVPDLSKALEGVVLNEERGNSESTTASKSPEGCSQVTSSRRRRSSVDIRSMKDVREVVLTKSTSDNSSNFGFLLDENHYVSKLLQNGASSDLLGLGDEVLAVNGNGVRRKSPEKIMGLLDANSRCVLLVRKGDSLTRRLQQVAAASITLSENESGSSSVPLSPQKSRRTGGGFSFNLGSSMRKKDSSRGEIPFSKDGSLKEKSSEKNSSIYGSPTSSPPSSPFPSSRVPSLSVTNLSSNDSPASSPTTKRKDSKGIGSIRSSALSSKRSSMAQLRRMMTPTKSRDKKKSFDKEARRTFGGNLSFHADLSRSGLPTVIELCINAIEERGLESEGIYRKSGVQSALSRLKEALAAPPYHPFEQPDWENVDSVSGLLKAYLTELHEPLVPHNIQDDLKNATASNSNELEKMIQVSKVLRRMPKSHLLSLRVLLLHLNRVAALEEKNKMSCANLAAIFGPSMLRLAEDREGSMVVEMSRAIAVVKYLMHQYTGVFAFSIREWDTIEGASIDPHGRLLLDRLVQAYPAASIDRHGRALEFCVAVRSMKATADGNGSFVQSLVDDIYMRFVGSGSPMEISIPPTIRNAIASQFLSPYAAIYDDAVKFVHNEYLDATHAAFLALPSGDNTLCDLVKEADQWAKRLEELREDEESYLSIPDEDNSV